MQEGWKYYNHALIPTTAPHEEIIKPKKGFWKGWSGTPLFARYTTDFDCGYETNWWYIIQDQPFDIMSIKAKHRWAIKKGLENFECKRIFPQEYSQEMAVVTLKDWATYPESYRPNKTKEELIKEYNNWQSIVYAAFDREDGVLSAFMGISDEGDYYFMSMGKSIPQKQKKQVNEALTYTYIMDISNEYANGKYLCNGERNLVHQTNFDDNLCRRYGFRKAYCKLNIKYRFPMNFFVKCLYPFRTVFGKFDNKIFHNVNSVLKMEEIRRNN